MLKYQANIQASSCEFNRVSSMAISPNMKKIAVGPQGVGVIDVNDTPTNNLRRLAQRKSCGVSDLTVIILDRPRHEDLIREVREAGARIYLIGDGDVSAAIATALPDTGIDMLLGTGGAPEGVIAAAAMRCIKGDFQGVLVPRNDADIERAKKMGIEDINKVFNFFEVNYKIYRYKHIITSPHYTKTKLFSLIDNEIENVKKGKTGYMKLKMNSISSFKMIDKLYEASRAGVKIQMVVRGICCLVPGIEGMSENIEVVSIIDKFLEHTRLYVFGNDGDPKVYISSADWMTRNIENRVEVSCPIYDEEIKRELLDIFDICWKDNTKARLLNLEQNNAYRINENKKVRAQFDTYEYYKTQLE